MDHGEVKRVKILKQTIGLENRFYVVLEYVDGFELLNGVVLDINTARNVKNMIEGLIGSDNRFSEENKWKLFEISSTLNEFLWVDGIPAEVVE